jgi:hypothetical protein
MFIVTVCNCGITCSRPGPTQTAHSATMPPEAYLVYFCLCYLCQLDYKHAYLYDTWKYVFWDVMLSHCTGSFLMFWRIIVPSPVGSGSPTSLGLLHPDHEGTTVLKNTVNHLVNNALSCPRRLWVLRVQIQKLAFTHVVKINSLWELNGFQKLCCHNCTFL